MLKIVNVRTGELLCSSEAKSESTEAVLGGGYVDLLFGGASFDKTAAGRATRKAINKAVDAISSSLPALCTHCGAKMSGKNVGEGGVCPRCGKTSETVVSSMTCPKCNVTVKTNDKFCGKCGESLAPAACPKCHALAGKGDKFCKECGATIKR